MSTKSDYARGLRDGLPIAAGYFAVSFALGIYAQGCGLTALQATVASLTTNASAGQYATFTQIRQQGTWLSLLVMTVIINARYLLMACALGQRLESNVPLWKRLLLGQCITDEIFAISVRGEGYVAPEYAWGALSVASPGWALGTFLGVIVGNILPEMLVNALGVGLYGMFIAIVIPPACKSRVLALVVVGSMVVSLITAALLPALSEGMRIVVLTVLLSSLAAVLLPVKEDAHA